MSVNGSPVYDENNVFARILRGEIPSKKVYENEWAFAFHDINPQAPVHVLVIPRRHITSLAEAEAGDEALLGHLLWVAAEIARMKGLANGYRTVISTGRDGGQTVDHLHVHVLGGRPMHWPPG